MFREAIERMAPYTPGEQPRLGQRLIKLNTNENPYPPSPGVRRAIVANAGASLRLYPSPRADAFVAAAARLYGMPASHIIAGNGSDELLSIVFRAALGHGDRVAYAQPTYSLYDTLASIQEARVVAVPLEHDYAPPLDGLARERAQLTVVCSPNSPCGTLADVDDLDGLARRLGRRLLVIDEAYVDFAESNALALVRRHRNVIVLRTLSKSFSLAGMRLGLLFAQTPIIESLLKVKDSYNLSRIAVAAGAQALDDAAWMRRNVEKVKRTRAITQKRLRELGFDVPPSSSNFVMARMAGSDMAPVAAALRRRGILVRHFPTSVFRDAIRISIGTPTEMSALFKALASLIKPVATPRRQQPRPQIVSATRMSRFGRLFDKFRSSSGTANDPPSPERGEIRWLVVGLGNPGHQYRRSRHNAGFMVIERLAAARAIELSKRKFNGFYGELREGTAITMLAMPQTFYNRSGEFVAGLSGYFKVPLERIIVIHDDMDLPTGRIRLKRGGGDAGNRGVRSIAEALGKDFLRVRVGIGHPAGDHGDVDHVLQPLGKDEVRDFEPVLERASEAVSALIRDGLERAMNQFNTR